MLFQKFNKSFKQKILEEDGAMGSSIPVAQGGGNFPPLIDKYPKVTLTKRVSDLTRGIKKSKKGL